MKFVFTALLIAGLDSTSFAQAPIQTKTVPLVSTVRVSSNEDCANNGMLGEAIDGSAVLQCSNHKWQDASKLEHAKVRYMIDGPGQGDDKRRTIPQTDASVGVPLHSFTSIGTIRPSMTSIDTTVIGFDGNNMAHVRIEIASDDDGRHWDKQIDAIVPAGIPTLVATDTYGVQYLVSVSKLRN